MKKFLMAALALPLVGCGVLGDVVEAAGEFPVSVVDAVKTALIWLGHGLLSVVMSWFSGLL